MRFIAGVACLLVGSLVLPAAFAVPGEVRKQELSVLKGQIKSLQDEIARAEESHDELADNLSESEKAISATQRRLRDVSQQRAAVEEEIRNLQAQQLGLEADLANARKLLGDVLFRIYVEGGQAGVRRFLGGDDPNQLSRDAYYLERVAQQRLAIIERARAALHDLAEVIRQTEDRRAELAALEKAQRNGQQSLLSERKKQQSVLESIESRLRKQRRQMQTLQHDENRIEKLLKGLERISRESSAKKQVSPPVVATVPSGGKAPGKVAGQAPAGKTRQPTIPPRAGGESADVAVMPGDADSAFAALKGRLRWPVKGELRARFGSQRAEGGAVWRGVFIRSSAGQEVRAVASGKVAFADWLRGFGNLIIVDHGNGYMTVYGNNDALFKAPGDPVGVGDVVASVGASGGLEESGLYFEIRYRGQAQDPAKWVATK